MCTYIVTASASICIRHAHGQRCCCPQACADKLARELESAADGSIAPLAAAAVQTATEDEGPADPTKFGGKKSKAAAKTLAGATQVRCGGVAACVPAIGNPRFLQHAPTPTRGALQSEILRMSGIPDEDIPQVGSHNAAPVASHYAPLAQHCRKTRCCMQFADTAHWLRYFPPLAKRDLAAMGCSIDWRRRCTRVHAVANRRLC